jgi:hypothetical protein
MALRAHIDVQVLITTGRAGLEAVAAAAGHLDFLICRMNIGFHDLSESRRLGFPQGAGVYVKPGRFANRFSACKAEFRHYRGMVRGAFQLAWFLVDVTGLAQGRQCRVD